MTILRLNGSTSGYTELSAPATAGNNTLVLPTGNGTAGQALTTDGNGATSWSTLIGYSTQSVSAAAQIDFTGIPSTAKSMKLILGNIDTGSSAVTLRLLIGDSGGLEVTGYAGRTHSYVLGNTLTNTAFSTAFNLTNVSSSNNIGLTGSYDIVNIGGNQWVLSGQIGCDANGSTGDSLIAFCNGYKTLSATLDRISVLASSGTVTGQATLITYHS